MLIRKVSFWSIKDNTTAGSQMWRKLLKYREIAKSLHKIDIRMELIPRFGLMNGVRWAVCTISRGEGEH